MLKQEDANAKAIAKLTFLEADKRLKGISETIISIVNY